LYQFKGVTLDINMQIMKVINKNSLNDRNRWTTRIGF